MYILMGHLDMSGQTIWRNLIQESLNITLCDKIYLCIGIRARYLGLMNLLLSYFPPLMV